MEPVWAPLEKRLGKARCAGFMFMGCVNGINRYKHGITRTYVNLDDKGNCYVPRGNGTFAPADCDTELGKLETSLGAGRQDAISDPGGAGREFNNITMGLMSAIDHYCAIRGFVLIAATNRLDGLDEALIREGRFDLKLRIDLPDEATRIKILEAQLSKIPWKRFDLREVCAPDAVSKRGQGARRSGPSSRLLTGG